MAPSDTSTCDKKGHCLHHPHIKLKKKNIIAKITLNIKDSLKGVRNKFIVG